MGKPRNFCFVSFSDKETLKQLFVDLKSVSDPSKTEEIELEDEASHNEVTATDPDESGLAISDSKFCSTCSISFSNSSEHREHFKLDWHRFNLRRKLRNKPPLKEDEFEKMVEKNNNLFDKKSEKATQGKGGKTAFDLTSDEDDDDISLSGSEDSLPEEEDDLEYQQELIKNRHPKFFFENGAKQIMSIYKCTFSQHTSDSKSNIPDTDFLFYISNFPAHKFIPKWAIILLGGGHFAGAIFEGPTAVAHKTFHCYTVRAKQGGSQSAADNKSGTSHPKSAGASLRRYNQAALADHVRAILTDWKSHFAGCDVIFFRAISGNRSILFGDGLLDKKDRRLRSIPFPTRRATFGEVKRVHDVLSSVEIHPETSLILSENLPNKSRRCQTKSNANLNKIHRSKSRESPKRQLPKVTQELASSRGGDSDDDIDEVELSWQQNVECSTQFLSEFENSAPPPLPKRSNKKKATKKNQQQLQDNDPDPDLDKNNEDDDNSLEAEPDQNDDFVEIRNHLVTACKVGDLQLLKDCLQNLDEKKVNMELGSDRWTALHIAAQGGKKQLVSLLLEHGADPTKRNKYKQVPYSLCLDKETRNCFRRFQASNPDKFDYSAAQIPIEKPLTAEEEARQAAKRNEKKKAQRAAKKEKEKLLKVQQEVIKKEEDEKNRFLNLSDREKRALAAEKRILESTGRAPSVQRCFQCGNDITGLVPFTYLEYKFCKPACVKEHRQKSK